MFIDLGITSFQAACRYVHELPYGYNSNSDDLMILFKEKKGTCTTKHAVIGTLAQELALPVHKNVGIYAMTEEIVSGTDDASGRIPSALHPDASLLSGVREFPGRPDRRQPQREKPIH